MVCVSRRVHSYLSQRRVQCSGNGQMPRSPLESACVKDLVVATPSPDMPGRFMSHIRVISSELPESAGATPTPAVHVGALTRAVSRLVFVTVTVRTPRCRQLTPIASTTWLPLTPMLSYASPAHCTASDKPYTAPVPTAPLQSDHRDSNCGSSREGKFVIVTFSPIEGASALNMAGPQWVYAIFHGLYC